MYVLVFLCYATWQEIRRNATGTPIGTAVGALFIRKAGIVFENPVCNATVVDSRKGNAASGSPGRRAAVLPRRPASG